MGNFNFSLTGGSSGISAVTITASANSTYNEIIEKYTLDNGNSAVTIVLAQEAAEPVGKYITISPDTLSYPASGDVKTVMITSNDNWLLDCDNWITPSVTGGTSGSTIVPISIGVNSGSDRTGIVKVICCSDSTAFDNTDIEQLGNYVKPYISLNPQIANIDYSGATGNSIAVDSNITWSVSADSQWITLNTESGSGIGSISYDVAENENGVQRQGMITVYNGDNRNICNIFQEAKVVVPYFSISPTGATVGITGGTVVISVSSNTRWEIEMEADRVWYSMDVLNGEGDGEVVVRVDALTVEQSRMAVIKFYAGDLKASFELTQEDVMAKRKIYYTSINGSVVTPRNINAFGGADIVSNTYVNGQGVIEFDKNVTVIGDSAFYLLSALTSVIIPNSVTTIESQAFYTCRNLNSVNLSESLTTIGDAAFAYCGNITNITIPNSVTSINQSAFWQCFSLTSVTIGNSVVSIGDNTFYYCTGLTSVNIPNSVTTMGDGVFDTCSGLTSVTLSNSLTEIGKKTFKFCRNLTAITIPSLVTSIGNEAFYYCDKLNYIYSYPTTEPSLGLGAFSYFKGTGTLHYPSGSDYSTWISRLPSGWTIAGDLPAQVEESE